MQILKFPIPIGRVGVARLLASGNMHPLSVQVQHGVPTLWLETDTSAPQVSYVVQAVFTGDHIPEDAEYIGTVLLGSSVIHYYLKEEK